MDTRSKIEELFSANAGYARTADVLAAGIHFSQLKKLEEAGVVSKIKRGYYRWEGKAFWGSELPEIARLVPQGVFCSVKVGGLPAGRVKLYYWSSSLFNFGIETILTEGGKIRITTAERTVCDLVKYRNKTGKDTMLEAIRSYLSRKEKSINTLLECARMLRVEAIIKPYLEIAI